MRLALVFSWISAAAYAEPTPGTGGDTLREMIAVSPAIVEHELLTGLAMRGGGPEDTVLLFDGFEVPYAFHGSGVRSIVPAGSIDAIELMPAGFGVDYGRGSSVVAMDSRSDRSVFAELTPVDFTAHAGSRWPFTLTMRSGWSRVVDDWRDTGDDGHTMIDAIGRFDGKLSKRWKLAVSGLYTSDDDERFTRLVVRGHYTSPESDTVAIALSPHWRDETDGTVVGVDHRLDGVITKAEAAGLSNVELRLGEQSNSARYTIGDGEVTRHDVGVWYALSANLSNTIRATTGLRLDLFDGDDLATQPRGLIAVNASKALRLGLAAGAYRRPPNQLHEVLTTTLNPERATHVVTAAAYDAWNRKSGRLHLKSLAYYIDRSRLVVRDQDGAFSNDGRGTALGLELSATLSEGPWLASVTTSLSSSVRQESLHARERPAEYDQPFRANLIGAYHRGAWTFGARLRLASGLPYTPVTGAIYDSETDTFEPLLDRPFSARMPFHHQIDLRVDYRADVSRRFKVDVFLDLHNAYANRDAIAYRYSYDFQQRIDITALPIFPFAGLRAYL